ncbi:hypothetical protein [Schinkia azotoformans]|uniref:hypothetical protein n=1 Tax=Schinkia azotoformans TaxID=1454 RepID=UPI002DB94693|nr:hypothetical protein [Schinkia azotoformans]MEC1747906.1 hypothetical protein [Schinkia azotoformans]
MKKIILSILLLLVLAGGGTAYYFLKVKTYDISQDAKLQEIVADEDYDIVLPPQDSPIEATDPQTENGGVSEQAPNDDSNSTSTNGTAKPKVTAETIKGKYRPSFESLESQANGKINALVGRAIGEYKEKKASGEKISYSYFLSKYKTAGEALEGKTDQAFNKLYGALQEDLKAHGFDPNEAAEFRSAYEAEKKARRNALLSSAMEKM